MMVVVMGVAGCGKSTVGRRLAARLGWPFHEGDLFHPVGNVARMARGEALRDQDRWPWLERIAAAMSAAAARGEAGVWSCSALRRCYRDHLAGAAGEVRFVHLCADHETIAARLERRRGHFMKAALLASQFATFEDSEDLVRVSVLPPPGEVVERIVAALGMERSAHRPRRPAAGGR